MRLITLSNYFALRRSNDNILTDAVSNKLYYFCNKVYYFYSVSQCVTRTWAETIFLRGFVNILVRKYVVLALYTYETFPSHLIAAHQVYMLNVVLQESYLHEKKINY